MLLQRGAARVVALDVGHGQIDWRLRNDPRVVVIEHFNARHLTPADPPAGRHRDHRRVVHLAAPDPAGVPAGAGCRRATSSPWSSRSSKRAAVKSREGIITDPAVHARVVDEVAAAGAEVGLTRVGAIPSPVTGQKGNVEFLLHLRAS